MSVCSLEDTHLSQDLLHPSIHSQCAGPIPSQIDTITIEDAEQREELVILPADQDVEASPKHTTTTTVSPTTVAPSTAVVNLDSNKIKYPTELISRNQTKVVGQNILSGTTTTTVSPITAAPSTAVVNLDSNKIKYPTELISLNQTRAVGQNILSGILLEACMKGYDDSLKHGKRVHFLSNLHLISFSEEGFLNYLQKPNIQKFKNTFSAALKLLSTIVSGHKHSPGDAGQGEEYPAHLVDVIKIYKKVLVSSEDTTKSASKENYNVQMDIVGFKSPIGSDSRASARMSTRETNGGSGHRLVERVKGKSGSAYHTPEGVLNEISGEATDKSKKKNKGSRKKSKIDVKHLVSTSNESRADMAQAVTNLAEILKPEGDSNGEIEFKKDVWEDKKSYRKMKHDSKKEKAVLDMLKVDRDEAISNWRDESDKELKDFYKSEFKRLAALYTAKSNDYCSMN